MIKEVISSAKCVEFVNKIDFLLNEILYSQNGYLSLVSKDAIEQYDKYIEKFDNELINLKKDINFENVNFIISCKKDSLLEKMNFHHKKQLLVWVMELYEEFINNILLNASINNSDNEKLSDIYNMAQEAINWFCGVKNCTPEEKQSLINKFDEDFLNALKTKDVDYMKTKTIKTDKKLFMELRKKILENIDDFLKIDLNEYQFSLESRDIGILNRYKSLLTSFKKTSLIDEIKLVDTCFYILNLNSEEERYDFLAKVEDDFNCFYSVNKKIDETDKISILKRRIEIFKSDVSKNNDYYKKLIIS